MIPCSSSMYNTTTTWVPHPTPPHLCTWGSLGPAQLFLFHRASAVHLHIASWHSPALIIRLVHFSLDFLFSFGSDAVYFCFILQFRHVVPPLCA